MQQLATNLVLLLEKQALQAVQADLLLRHGRGGGEKGGNPESELANVKLDDLVMSVMMHMNSLPLERHAGHLMYSRSNAFFVQILSIVAAFDAVDIDNRGVVNFTDFTNFCLRVGRLLLKPSIKRTLKNYLLSHDSKTTLYPSERMRFLPNIQLLFVFDADNPRARLYSKDTFVTRINPIRAAKKSLFVTMSKKLTYYEKVAMEKQATQLRITERELDDSKGSLLDVVFVESTKQYVFTCSHSYLIFLDGSQHLYDDKGEMKVVGHVKTSFPMHVVRYCKVLDMILAIPGEGSDHVMEMYEPSSRKLKFRINKHDTKILSLCEVNLDRSHPLKDHYFVSSSLDGKVIFWPTAPLSTLLNKMPAQRLLRMSETVDYDLKGHHHAIHSLVYARHQEIIIGAGFDFEIFAWDPFTRDMCMKFAGHFKSIAGIQMVYIPEERLLSIDETGTMKIWNVSKELGVYGTQEHTFQVQLQQPAHIRAFSSTYTEGKGVAVLAEKLYFLNLENDLADELKPVQQGLGVCPTSGKLFAVFKTTIHLIDILSSRLAKSMAFLDPDRVSSTDQLVSRGDELKLTAPSASASAELPGLRSAGHIDIRDTVTACAIDANGKKVFLGTLDGRVLLFDSFTFGLVKQLTDEEEDSTFRFQGAVASLAYVDRDELLVAVYSAGAVKVFGGCLHHAYSGQKFSVIKPQRRSNKMGMDSSNNSSEDFIPSAKGGKPPIRPFLLRECDLGVLPDFSVRAVAVSEGHNLVAVLCKQGSVYVYDYLNLSLYACLSLENHFSSATTSNSRDTVRQYVAIQFMPMLPILLIVDNTNWVQVWTTKPMSFKFLLAWNALDQVSYERRISDVFENLIWNGIEASLSSSLGGETFQALSGSVITSMRCYSFMTHCKTESHGNDADEIHVPPNQSGAAAVGSSPALALTLQRKWILVLGTDGGQMMTADISDLPIQSGAIDYIPRPDAFYLAHQRIKPRRYAENTAYGSSSIPRTRFPEELLPKLVPVRPEDTFDIPLHSHAMSGIDSESKVVKLSRQQTRKNLRQQAKSAKRCRLDGPLTDYVQGIQGWTVFAQGGVREWQSYDPFFNYPQDRLSSERCSFVPNCSQLVDRLPLLFVISDAGQVKCVSFNGMLLGEALEEIMENSTKGPKASLSGVPFSPATVPSTPIATTNISSGHQQKDHANDTEPAASALGEKTLKEVTANSTFITALVQETPLDFLMDSDALDGGSATIYVKSEKRTSLMARKVSIQPKGVFDFSPFANQTSSSKHFSRSSLHTSSSLHGGRGAHVSSPLVEDPPVECTQLNYCHAPVNGILTSSSKFPWSFPMVAVALPMDGVKGEKKEVLAVPPVVQMTWVQFTYYKDVLSRLLPHIEHEINARFRARFDSFSGESVDSLRRGADGKGFPPLNKQVSTYLTRFASAENLLQGLNSFLLDKKTDKVLHKDAMDNSNASAITTMHVKNLTSTETRDNMLEKIILTMSDREIAIADMLKEQKKEKWERQNLYPLIDHIQSSEAFDDDLKKSGTSSFFFKNYEKEKMRGKRAPWESTQRYANLDYEALKSEYFGHKKSKAASKKAMNQSAESTNQIEQVGKEKTEEVEGQDEEGQTVPISEEKIAESHAEEKVLGEIEGSTINASDCISAPTTSSIPNLVKAGGEKMQISTLTPFARPATAPGAMQRKPPLAASTPSRLRSPIPAHSISRSPMSAFVSPRMVAPSSSLLSASRPPSAETKRIDGLIDQLEVISVVNRRVGSIKRSSSGSKKKKGMDGGVAARPKTASARINLTDNDNDSVARNLSSEFRTLREREEGEEGGSLQSEVTDPLRRQQLLISGSTASLAFAANKERVDEIHQRFEESMLTLKSAQQTYQHYDPLRQKRLMEMVKHRRKLELRLRVAQEGNSYVEDERFEGIVDVEKEAKKQESKHILAQSRATGRRTGYGLYKYVDLIKFIHFLQFCSEIEVPIYERNTMYFYDETGNDVSKFVREQPYYIVDEVIHYVQSLFGSSAAVDVLLEGLITYRDEVPRSSRIALYNLIGIIFAMSKGWGIQLRIYMFVTCTHMIYGLLRGALPPKDQLREGFANSPQSPDSGANSATEREGEKFGLSSTPQTPSRLRSSLQDHLERSREITLQKQDTMTTIQSVLSAVTSSSLEPVVSAPPIVPAIPPPALDEIDANLVAPEEEEEMAQVGSADLENISAVVEGGTAAASVVSGNLPLAPSPAMELARRGSVAVALTSAQKAVIDHTFFHNILEEQIEKFVVCPHPLRGFRQWIVRRKAFNAVTRVLNFWCDGSIESLTVNDLTEIIFSLVPAAQHDNFRIMRVFPSAIHRLGLNGAQELNGSVLAKVFQTALEIKVVSD
eukprot:gene3277-3594_t